MYVGRYIETSSTKLLHFRHVNKCCLATGMFFQAFKLNFTFSLQKHGAIGSVALSEFSKEWKLVQNWNKSFKSCTQRVSLVSWTVVTQTDWIWGRVVVRCWLWTRNQCGGAVCVFCVHLWSVDTFFFPLQACRRCPGHFSRCHMYAHSTGLDRARSELRFLSAASSRFPPRSFNP